MELRILQLNEDASDVLFNSPDCQMLLNIYKDFYPKFGFHLPWVAYLIIVQNQVVGTCSFTGKPNNGAVEIAYWTFKEFEGKGIASFACKELINISRIANPSIIITAKTAPEHNASTKILQKHNFVFTNIVQDDEIGDAWLWELKPEGI